MSDALEPRPRAVRFAVAALFAAALALRIGYGWFGAHQERFWDERFSFENVRAVLGGSTFEPPRGYYPSPVFFGPPAALIAVLEHYHEATGDSRFDALDDAMVQPAGYRSARLLTALIGASAVPLLFVLGRRLYGTRAGLVAAFLLAFVPWHVHASGVFKPDALLVTAVVVAIYLTVRALERPSWRWSVLAGLAIAIAASAKLTGLVAAAPLLVGTLLGGWLGGSAAARLTGGRRWWLLLGVGALVGGLGFVLANPYWLEYPGYLAKLEQEYSVAAAMHGWGHLDALRLSMAFLADRWVHGPIGAVLAALGWAGLIVAALFRLRRRRGEGRPAGNRQAIELAVLLLPLLWVAAYAAETGYFKPNNILPVVPFTCLMIGVTLDRTWRWARSAIRPRWRRPFASAAIVGLAVVVVAPAWRYVYRECVPHTLDLAERFLRESMRRQGYYLVYAEAVERPQPPWHGSRAVRGATVAVPQLAGVPRSKLIAADGLVFRAKRLFQPGARDHAMLMTLAERRDLRVFSARWFRVRGPDLVAVRRVRRVVANVAIELDDCGMRGRCFTGTFEAPEAAMGSMTAEVPTRTHAQMPAAPGLRIAGEITPLHAISSSARTHRLTTDRLATPRGPIRVRLVLPEGTDLDPILAPALGWTAWAEPPS